MPGKHHLTVIAALCVFACDRAEYHTDKASELVDAFEEAGSIDAKFDIYERVYASERPPNFALASPLAELGDQAFFLALERAQTGENLTTIMASLEIIRLFTARNNRRCSDDDEELIRRNIEKHLGDDDLTTLKEILRRSCSMNQKYAPIIRLPANETLEQAH